LEARTISQFYSSLGEFTKSDVVAHSIKAAKRSADGQKLPFIRAMNELGVVRVTHALFDELDEKQ
jgi:hypothetical protein